MVGCQPDDEVPVITGREVRLALGVSVCSLAPLTTGFLILAAKPGVSLSMSSGSMWHASALFQAM